MLRRPTRPPWNASGNETASRSGRRAKRNGSGTGTVTRMLNWSRDRKGSPGAADLCAPCNPAIVLPRAAVLGSIRPKAGPPAMYGPDGRRDPQMGHTRGHPVGSAKSDHLGLPVRPAIGLAYTLTLTTKQVFTAASADGQVCASRALPLACCPGRPPALLYALYLVECLTRTTRPGRMTGLYKKKARYKSGLVSP